MQSVPDGYEALDFVGFTDRGEFSSTEAYIENDIVHWNNTAWRCLKDNTTGITPAEGENWTVFIASETDSSGITTTDTEGLVGSAGEKVSNQDLIDAIADRVINRLLSKSAISTTQINDQEKVPSSALVFGIAEEIGELNENITWKYLGHDGLRRRINLPEIFTELQITAVSDVLKEVNEQCRYSINILYAQLSDETEMEFRAGHFYRPYAENSASIGITATRKYIFVNWSSESSNDTSNSAYIYVWYR